MTKQRLYIFISVICLAGVVFYFVRKAPAPSVSSPVKEESGGVAIINPEKLEIQGQKIVGLKKGKEKEEIKKLRVANSPSPEWRKSLENTLKHQGGDAIKELKIEKVDSFVWAHEGVALFVESVLVTVKNDKDFTTTFRVLVDAQNGKILKNWDQPVIDPANPREAFRVRIDPRYHND